MSLKESLSDGSVAQRPRLRGIISWNDPPFFFRKGLCEPVEVKMGTLEGLHLGR